MKKLLLVFSFLIMALFAYYFYRPAPITPKTVSPSILKVSASSSFNAGWGPGPLLKAEFEKTCNCIVELINGSEVYFLMQKINLDPNYADVLLSLDQFDKEKLRALPLQKIAQTDGAMNSNVSRYKDEYFTPYEWGVLSFVYRPSEVSAELSSVDDLLKPEFKNAIALEDPRTSTVGLQFLEWIIQIKGPDKAFEFIKKLNSQALSYAPSWSTAYGFFKHKQAKLVFSYSTSPLYHLIEEKDKDYRVAVFNEGQPVQVNFASILSSKNKALAEKFVHFLVSKEGQKIIFEKNYMLPALSESLDTNLVKDYKILGPNILNQIDIEQALLKWQKATND